MKAELLEAPVAVRGDIVLKVEVERDGQRDVFVVTMSAPRLFEYVPYVADVRKAIARVVKQHEAELQAMFDRMG